MTTDSQPRPAPGAAAPGGVPVDLAAALARSCPLLSDLPPPELGRLLEQAERCRFRVGRTLLRSETAVPELFLLLEGSVRSVVFSARLRHRVATLERLGPGALLGLTALEGGTCRETLIASSDGQLLALPRVAIEAVMQRQPAFGRRLRQRVAAAELFAVLDAHLRECPLPLSQELVAAAVQLAPLARVLRPGEAPPSGWLPAPAEPRRDSEAGHPTLPVGQAPGERTGEPLPDSMSQPIGVPLAPIDAAPVVDGDRGVTSSADAGPSGGAWIWLVAAGPLPLGTAVEESTLSPGQSGLKLIGLERLALQRLLAPEPAAGGNGTQVPRQRSALLLESWEASLRARDAAAPAASAPIELAEPADQEDPERLPPESFPWHRGQGPVESPVAAFRMLSDHLGLPFRRDLLRRVYGDQVARHGEASLALAGALAETIGLQTQLVRIGSEALVQLSPPLLLRWGNGLAVVYRCDRRRLVLGIPAVGNRELSLEEFREQWGETGEVLTLQVGALTPKRRFGFAWFLPALRRHRTVLLEVLLASFFVQLFGLVNPLLIQQVIDKVIINNSPSALGVLGLLLVVFALFEGLLLCLRTFLFVDTTNRLDLALGSQIIDHLLRLPLAYFDHRSVGEVSSRIAELEKVRGFLTGTALTTILDSLFAVIYIAVMLVYSWQLTLLTLAVIPLLILLTVSVSPIVREQLQRRAVANARTQSHLVEVLSSMMTVKAQNIELRSRWKWQDLYSDYVSEGFDNTLVSTTANSVGAFLNKLSSLIVIWAGASLVLGGQLTLGELIAFRIIAGYVTGPLLRMTSIWQSVQETALSLERLSDVIDHPQEAPEDNGRRMLMPLIEGEIAFRAIDFRYRPSSPLLLHNLNLTIPRGAFVAIVGSSGSGKSTLAKLLARLYEPEQGMVLVDGIDISKVELYSLRRQIGIVPQDTVLFDGTIEENITLTNPEASSEEMIEAARIAAAHDFIMALPAGYSTQVGERGSALSGGQRQRLAIARTILQKPRLLIMDEATSALDYQSERQVSENLMRALRGCTVLFITHRLSSIVRADRIVCMGAGRVLEVGTHDELMAAHGPYHALFRQQAASGTNGTAPPPVASGNGVGPAPVPPLQLLS